MYPHSIDKISKCEKHCMTVAGLTNDVGLRINQFPLKSECECIEVITNKCFLGTDSFD